MQIRYVAPVVILASGFPSLAQEPASAPLSDTVQAVLENGAIMVVQGTRTGMDYEADGTIGGIYKAFGGTWTAEGRTICIDLPGIAANQCLEYPDGKTSGDTFEIETQHEPIVITIE